MNIVDLDKLCERFWDGNFMEIHKDDIPSIPSAFDGMTNGEVIQALFPYVDIEDLSFDTVISTNLDEGCVPLRRDWWNAPYKAESEVSKYVL